MLNVQRSLADAQVACQTGGVSRERELQRRVSSRRGRVMLGKEHPSRDGECRVWSLEEPASLKMC